jgi:putative FmdB family regulatory protein
MISDGRASRARSGWESTIRRLRPGILAPGPAERVLCRRLAVPLYDYQCKDCGEAFEVRATIKEKEVGLVLACPKCGSPEARQMLTFASMLHGGKLTPQPTCGPSAGSGCCG